MAEFLEFQGPMKRRLPNQETSTFCFAGWCLGAAIHSHRVPPCVLSQVGFHFPGWLDPLWEAVHHEGCITVEVCFHLPLQTPFKGIPVKWTENDQSF